MSGVSGSGGGTGCAQPGQIGWAQWDSARGAYVLISIGQGCCGGSGSGGSGGSGITLASCGVCENALAAEVWQTTCPLNEAGISSAIPDSPWNVDGGQMIAIGLGGQGGCLWSHAHVVDLDTDQMSLEIFPADNEGGDPDSLIYHAEYYRGRFGGSNFASWRYTTTPGDKDCTIPRTLSLYQYSVGMNAEVVTDITVSPA